jgi:release factor glutamine methyltransferase
MTAAEALSRARASLRERSASARLDATRLLADVLGRDAAWLHAHGEHELSPEEGARFEAAIARRERGEPVAYITGRAGFYGREFAVTPAVLVPRPESELLVELVLAALRAPSRESSETRILDVGTGSGALAIALALELPAARVSAVDISGGALEVAARNARAHGVEARVAFVPSDLSDGLPPGPRFDAIVANLPYVPSAELAAAPDPTAFEPRLALDGGADGLALYRRLLAHAPELLAPGGILVMEAAPPTAGPLAALARAAFTGTAAVRIVPDLAGLERAIVAQLGGSRTPGANANGP